MRLQVKRLKADAIGVSLVLVLLTIALIGELSGATVEAPGVRAERSDAVALERQRLAQSALGTEDLEHKFFHMVACWLIKVLKF